MAGVMSLKRAQEEQSAGWLSQAGICRLAEQGWSVLTQRCRLRGTALPCMPSDSSKHELINMMQQECNLSGCSAAASGGYHGLDRIQPGRDVQYGTDTCQAASWPANQEKGDQTEPVAVARLQSLLGGWLQQPEPAEAVDERLKSGFVRHLPYLWPWAPIDST
jgi:hypothetical protein